MIDIPDLPAHNIQTQVLIYAAIRQAKISKPSKDNFRIDYYEELGRLDIVDLNQVKCVVGRIRDRNKWAIIDRSGSKPLT